LLNTKIIDNKIICTVNDFDLFKEIIDKRLKILIPNQEHIAKSFIDETIEYIIKTILIDKISILKIELDRPYLISINTFNVEYHYVVANYSDERFGKGFSICETMIN